MTVVQLAERESLEDELNNLRVPTFKYPWPEAVNPHAAEAEANMINWADKQGLFVDSDKYRDRVARTKYAWLAARCYPNASPELLSAIANYFVFFFLVDDFFVDRVESVGPDTLRNLTAMIDVLDFNALGANPVYAEEAWLDVTRTLRDLLGPVPYERFATGMRLWATTAGLQILNHLRTEPCGMRQYETIRRHTGGMGPCVALSDSANGGAVEPEEFYRPEVQQLCNIANNVVCWSNDVQSLAIEARQPGQFRNMVIIRAIEGYTLQESVDWTAARVDGQIAEFSKVAETVLPTASPRLQGFIEGLQFWMRGYQDWVEKDTKRYATAYVSGDADDRGVIA